MAAKKKAAKKKAAKKKAARGRATGLDFAEKLILFRWLLREFGFADFAAAKQVLAGAEEGLTADGRHRYLYALMGAARDKARLGDDALAALDGRIVSVTRKLNEARGSRAVRWKYFQWLALAFVELYLERWFDDPEALRVSLDAYQSELQAAWPERERLPPWTADDLRKLAVWTATGSGKTLVMHANVLQFRAHLARTSRARDFDRALLITPNEGLTRQHVAEFKESGLPAEPFEKDAPGLFAGRDIEVLDINKLKKESGEKTVAVDAFGARNLVLVDEGHRGAGGDTWRDMRDAVAREGFTFEYSATFRQAIGAVTSRSAALTAEYGKAILLDYSYRHFHGDGYGKDYRVFNLDDAPDDETSELYLTAALLAFHQQARLFADRRGAYAQENLEKPLWLFVGRTVVGNKDDDAVVTDIETVLRFLAGFLRDRRRAERRIARLLSGATGLLDRAGNDLLMRAFPYLTEMAKPAPEIYADILASVFNAPAGGALHMDELKGTQGELGLRVGAAPYFGVINVGNAAGLRKKIDESADKSVNAGEQAFKGSLFAEIDRPDSPITMLLGAKKFAEGWNSFRVASIGLMNIGRSEGAEIIQLFGRGVRLWGRNRSLKRHTAPDSHRPFDPKLSLLETLNVFGVKADYMQKFQEYLEEEGAAGGADILTITMPTVVNLPKKTKLHVFKLPDGLDFKREAAKPVLGAPQEGFGLRQRAIVDWYPRVQAAMGALARNATGEGTVETGVLTPAHVAFLDIDPLWFALQEFKAERAWFNLDLPRAAIARLLRRNDWYVLRCPASKLAFDDVASIPTWQEIAEALLKAYCEKLYLFAKDAWESPRLRLVPLEADDSNLVAEHTIRIERTPANADLIARLLGYAEDLRAGKLGDFEAASFRALAFDRHLYAPLLCAADGIVIQPVALNAGERRFVEDLRAFYRKEASGFFAGKELYVLRNQSRGRGMGFFEAHNYHPDFVVWLVDGARQHLVFVDPKGLLLGLQGLADGKIQFHKTIKARGPEAAKAGVVLDAFILSETPFDGEPWWGQAHTQAEFEANHVLFPDAEGKHIAALFAKLAPA